MYMEVVLCKGVWRISFFEDEILFSGGFCNPNTFEYAAYCVNFSKAASVRARAIM